MTDPVENSAVASTKTKSAPVTPSATISSAADSTPEAQASSYRTLVSRLDHPVYLDYNDNKIVVPPRGIIRNVDKTLLGDTPKGITLTANTGNK